LVDDELELGLDEVDDDILVDEQGGLLEMRLLDDEVDEVISLEIDEMLLNEMQVCQHTIEVAQ
jgi:hypothetical protein